MPAKPVQLLSKDRFLFKTDDGYKEWVPPRNKQELKLYAQMFFGLTLADRSVCPNHSAPLDVLWEAYSASSPTLVWKGSRGLAGKSTLVGLLSILEILEGANVTVLGGSAEQSRRVHELESGCWNHRVKIGDQEVDGPFKAFLAEEPTGFKTKTKYGNILTAITASSKSARGPHPQRLRIDEVDELDLNVYTSSLGQAMDDASRVDGHFIRNQTLISSTHQYPDKTMTYVLKQAEERGWPVREWCYKESHVDNGGWLTQQMIDDKKSQVPDQMWDIEYELGEPSIEGRQLSEQTIFNVFEPERRNPPMQRPPSWPLGLLDDKVNHYYQFERWDPDGLYASGADWARDFNFTVIITIRYDCTPMRVVAYERRQKEDYPLMADCFTKRCQDKFPSARAAHDGNGVGVAVCGMLPPEMADPVLAQGVRRLELFGDYINVLSNGLLISPEINFMKNEHKYVTYDHLYGAKHAPDSFVAGALAVCAALGKSKEKKKFNPGRIIKVMTF